MTPLPSEDKTTGIKGQIKEWVESYRQVRQRTVRSETTKAVYAVHRNDNESQERLRFPEENECITEIYRQTTKVENFNRQSNEILTDNRHVDPPIQTLYTLQSSIDGSNWTDYKEIGQVKSLKGNGDRNSEIQHILNADVLVRYLQFLPGTHHGGVCLRAEVFGVKQKPENLALGKPTNQSSTYSDALIGAAESGRAVDGNADTDMLNKHCSHTNQDNPSWWQVDLALGHAAVYEIHIVNRFTGDPGKNNVDYKITFGNSIDVASNHECTGRYSFHSVQSISHMFH
ncbi:uncharacterized protein LOC110048018 [Orbicella faveolata]|uniref:uncharacterized protein LOC110048018 n=1 Tax=Orbicella faveolata TaxID=48498 RepID=UPI0009E22A55|nr:uncharacterized protein LOC110048018 [Orbicella faveolata]